LYSFFYHNCYVKKTAYINFTLSNVRVGEYPFKLLEWKRVTKKGFVVHSPSLIVASHAISSIVLRSYQNLVDLNIHVSPACTFLTTYMKWNYKTVSNGCPIWAPMPKMGLKWYCINLQQSTYMWDPFLVTTKAQPKYEYSLSWRLICRKGSLLGPVVGEDQK